MRITSAGATNNIRWAVICATVLCLSAGLQAATARTEVCSALSPGTHVRVRLTMAPDVAAVDERALKGVVERLWNTEGLEVEWVPENVPFSWDGVDLWVNVKKSRLANAEPTLSAVHMEDGQAHRLLQVSIESTIDMLKGAVSRKYQIQEASAVHMMFAGGLRDVEDSIGYMIAREMNQFAAAR